MIARNHPTYTWWHHTPVTAYTDEERFVIGFRAGAERRHVYRKINAERQRAAVRRLLASFVI